MKSLKELFRRKQDAQPTTAPDDSPTPLRIEGIAPAPLTPEPDDAELAAAALLELMASEERRVKSEKFATARKNRKGKHARADLQSDRNEYKDLQSDKNKERIANADTHSGGITNPTERANPTERTNPAEQGEDGSTEANSSLFTLHSSLYYRHLAEKIRQTREHQRLRVTRFLAFVEQELRHRHLPAYGPGSLGLLEAELYKRMDIVDREEGPLKRRWQHCLAEVTVRLMQAARTETTDGTEKADGDGAGKPTVT